MAFYGIGPGPDGTEQLGCCSQMALFVRQDFYEMTLKDCGEAIFENSSCCSKELDTPELMKCESTLTELISVDTASDGSSNNDYDRNDGISDAIDDMTVGLATTHIDTETYRLITSFVYPKNMDERSQEQKIFDEACFHLSRYMNLDDDHYDADNDVIKVPVKQIFELVYKYTSDINEFR